MEPQNMRKEVWPTVLEPGVAIVPAPLSKTVWERLYVEFDKFAQSVSGDTEFSKRYNVEAKEWQKEKKNRELYGGYFSPYFRDTSKIPGRDKKRIVQLCEPYYRHLHQKNSVLLTNPFFVRLIDGMMAALYSCCAAVTPILNDLEEIEPFLYERLMLKAELPPVSLRLLSYDADPQFATNPHVDKSAFTVIVDADDPVEASKTIFCPHAPESAPPKLSSFKPIRKNANEALLFLGAAPRVGGFANFLPMPHAVGPFEGVVRHSAVFFWHLPNTDMQDFDTKIAFEDDMGLARKPHSKTQ